MNEQCKTPTARPTRSRRPTSFTLDEASLAKLGDLTRHERRSRSNMLEVLIHRAHEGLLGPAATLGQQEVSE